MTSAQTGRKPLEKLIDETRAARKQLHVLLERLRNERETWERDIAALPRRPRLTATQRHRFRTLLVTRQGRRGRW